MSEMGARSGAGCCASIPSLEGRMDRALRRPSLALHLVFSAAVASCTAFFEQPNGGPDDPSGHPDPLDPLGPIVGPPPKDDLIGRSGLRRLTADELDNTLNDLLFEKVRAALYRLPTEQRLPFDNDYRQQTSSIALVDGLQLLAKETSRRLLEDIARRDRVVG